jgi:hypothetical protein
VTTNRCNKELRRRRTKGISVCEQAASHNGWHHDINRTASNNRQATRGFYLRVKQPSAGHEQGDCIYDSQVSVRYQNKSFPKNHLGLTFWFRLVHVINHSRTRDVKSNTGFRHISVSKKLKIYEFIYADKLQ